MAASDDEDFFEADMRAMYPPIPHSEHVLVLASASPRRAEILESLGLGFVVETADVEEFRRPQEAPVSFAKRLAREKAFAVSSRLGERARFVMGADTIVVIDEDALGKPTDDAHARAMLSRLSGRWHEVITAVAIVGRGGRVRGERCVTTRVRFRALEEQAIARYVATGEGRDKAGGYAIQGLGAGLVTHIDGSYGAVVGLPAAETVDLLLETGAVESWP